MPPTLMTLMLLTTILMTPPILLTTILTQQTPKNLNIHLIKLNKYFNFFYNTKKY